MNCRRPIRARRSAGDWVIVERSWGCRGNVVTIIYAGLAATLCHGRDRARERNHVLWQLGPRSPCLISPSSADFRPGSLPRNPWPLDEVLASCCAVACRLLTTSFVVNAGGGLPPAG